MVSAFSQAVQSGKFLVTAEVEPPKGVDLAAALEKGRILKGLVDAVNVTDQQASVMRASPWAVCRVLKDNGLEPIMQVTTRDRNRIAMQADLLAAAVLGIENVLCLTGDPTGTGDHPDAKPVFDIDVVALLRAGAGLNAGKDMAGHDLQGAPNLFLGAVANPGARPLEPELVKLENKVKAGARFIQTQAVYDVEEFARFMDQVKGLDVAVLAGIIPLKSGNQARFMNKNIPGIRVPDAVMEEMDGAEDRVARSVEIAARTIRDLRPLCRGMHIMAMGWERHIPAILEASGVLPEESREPR